MSPPPTMRLTTSFMLVFGGDEIGLGAAVAQHDDAVGDRQHVVQPVRDQDDGDAFRLQPADQVEHALHLAHGKRRRRLVHDDQLRVEGQRTRDRHRLLLAARERADRAVDRRQMRAQPLDHLCRLAVHLGLVDKAGNQAEQLLHRLAAEEDVGGHVLLLGQRQVLVDHLDAELAPLAGIERQDVLAVELDRAGIGAVNAGDGLHQRRLAGAIVADQADHFAGLDRRGRRHAARRPRQSSCGCLEG